MNWLTVALAVIAAVGGGSGLYAILTVGATRKKIGAEADEAVAGSVRTIIGGATDSVKLLRETVADAGRAVTEAEQRVERVNADLRVARSQVEEYGRRVDQLTREAERAYGELRRLRMAILDPGATLERLREMADPPGNGRP